MGVSSGRSVNSVVGDGGVSGDGKQSIVPICECGAVKSVVHVAENGNGSDGGESGSTVLSRFQVLKEGEKRGRVEYSFGLADRNRPISTISS